MKYAKKMIMICLFVFPFLMGLIGNVLAGNEVLDAAYASVSLYFMNLVLKPVNIWTEIARWTAPLVTASGILLALRGVMKRIKDYILCFREDSTAVYGDSESARTAASLLSGGTFVSDRILGNAKNHVLMFEDDVKNLDFYQDHESELISGKVYMKLEQIDSSLLKENHLRFFNVNEIICRNYWKKRNLLPYLQNGNIEVEIAIIGFDELGQKLLTYGLMNNIYTPSQKIVYHIFGDSDLYENIYKDFPMMNQDRVIYYGKAWEKCIDVLRKMKRIIVTEEEKLKLLQSLISTCPDVEIDYYSKEGPILEHVFKTEELHSFGYTEEIYTDDNIKKDALYRLAKELNYRYVCMYGSVEEKDKEKAMEEEWEKLDGFTKGSNIASADYHTIRVKLMKCLAEEGKELTKDELSEAEHIRWSRFHFIHHWSYGIPENGKNKDAFHKIHKCLVPYDELPQNERDKDYEAIQLLLEMQPVLFQ